MRQRGQLGEATTSAHSEREQHESEAEVDEAATSMAMEYHTTRVAAVESLEVAGEAEMANFTVAIMSSMAAKRSSNGDEAAAEEAMARTAVVTSFGGDGWRGIGWLALVEDVGVAKVWKVVGGSKVKVQTEAAARGKQPESPQPCQSPQSRSSWR